MGIGMDATEAQSVLNYQCFTQIKQNLYSSANECVDVEIRATGK
jgi:hypothetical protein